MLRHVATLMVVLALAPPVAWASRRRASRREGVA
jgi:hypothetical protein